MKKIYWAFCSEGELEDAAIMAESQNDARLEHKRRLEDEGYTVELSPKSEAVWATKDGHEFEFYGYSEE